jgi:hypothetical protein
MGLSGVKSLAAGLGRLLQHIFGDRQHVFMFSSIILPLLRLRPHLVVGLADIDKLWLEGSTSNEESINVVGLGYMSVLVALISRTKLDTVLSANGTTVDDPGSIGDGLGYSLGEPVSDIDVSLLGLFDRGDLSGTNSPNGFVGDDNVPTLSAHHPLCILKTVDSLPGRLGDITSNSIQLPLYNFLSLVSFPLFQRFSNTSNNSQTSFNSCLYLFSDKLVGIAKHGSSFGMTKDDPMDIGIFKLVGRDFTSECSRCGCEAVLGGYL